ncbi:hypothetical protein BH24ACT6_BH24ACT6_09480 [soil metagenome]
MPWTLAVVPAVAGALVWSLQPLNAVTGRAPRGRWALGVAASTALALTLALAVWAAGERPAGTVRWSVLLPLYAGVDDSAAVMAILVPAVALPVVAFAAAHEARLGLERLLGLLVVFVGGMELRVVAEDLLVLLIGWELVGLLSWALINHVWSVQDNASAAAHAFITTRAGDLGLFAALGAAVAGAGSLRYADLDQLTAGWRTVFVAGIVVAAAAKSAQLPFSPWLFSAMAGPSSVSALLHSATMVAAGAFVLIRLHPVLDAAAWFQPVVVVVGMTTALVAAGVAVGQRHAKRLLAASTSAQYGLMFVAVGVGAPTAALAHLVSHAAFKALLFLAAGIALGAAGSNELTRQRLGRTLPLVGAAALVGALALAAVPPLGGAWTKELIVSAAGHEAVLLALLVVVAGGLSAVYATRWFLLAYGSGGRRPDVDHRPGPIEHVALLVLGTACVVFGLLWLPGARDIAERTLGGRLLEGAAWELVASIVALAVGAGAGSLLAAGDIAATRLPSRLNSAAEAWLGIPWLARVLIVDPTLGLARSLARFDNTVVDAGVGAVATAGRVVSRTLAAGDDRVVDAGVRFTAAAVRLLARLLTTRTEVRVDSAVHGVAAGVGGGVRLARRLQTGLTHQYYVIAAAGLVALVLVALVGR